MNKTPTISIDLDEIERLKQFLPGDTGFCTGEVQKALGLTVGQAKCFMQRLWALGLIEPGGMKRLANVHGTVQARPCWRWAEESPK